MWEYGGRERETQRQTTTETVGGGMSGKREAVAKAVETLKGLEAEAESERFAKGTLVQVLSSVDGWLNGIVREWDARQGRYLVTVYAQSDWEGYWSPEGVRVMPVPVAEESTFPVPEEGYRFSNGETVRMREIGRHFPGLTGTVTSIRQRGEGRDPEFLVKFPDARQPCWIAEGDLEEVPETEGFRFVRGDRVQVRDTLQSLRGLTGQVTDIRQRGLGLDPEYAVRFDRGLYQRWMAEGDLDPAPLVWEKAAAEVQAEAVTVPVPEAVLTAARAILEGVDADIVKRRDALLEAERAVAQMDQELGKARADSDALRAWIEANGS